MSRTISELRNSQGRLRAAAQMIANELAAVEAELRQLENSTKLDEDFFWEEVAPILLKWGSRTGAEIQKELANKNLSFTVGSFRTFLSRQRRKGSLLEKGQVGRASRLALSPTATEAAKSKIGKA